MARLAPGHVFRRLSQSIAEWPTGRTDGLLAVLWSLVAWVFVLATAVLVGILVVTSQRWIDLAVTDNLVQADGTVFLLGLAGVFLLSCTLLAYRLGYWRGVYAARRRAPSLPAPRPIVQPDPEVTRSDRVMGGLWLYLTLVGLVAWLSG